MTGKTFGQLFCGMLTAGSLLLAGCAKESGIDLNDIDMTIGVGTDGFALPGNNSTKQIPLIDVLDIDDSDCIETDAQGNYRFYKRGNDVSTKPTRVDPIVIRAAAEGNQNFDFEVDLSSAAPSIPNPGRKHAPMNLTEKRIRMFTFEATHDTAVVSLTHADVTATVTVNLKFTGLDQVLAQIKTMTITLPTFLELRNESNNAKIAFDATANVLTVSNWNTADELTATLALTGLKDFLTAIPTATDAANYIALDKNKVKMNGDVKMGITIDTDDVHFTGIPTTTVYAIHATTSISPITINGATGKFAPAIDLNDIGSINITDIPDFLNDDEVTIKVNNPQIALNISSDIDVQGIVDGTIEATYKDNTTKKMDINGMVVKRNTTSRIVICRTPGNEAGVQYVVKNGGSAPAGYTNDLQDLLTKIPTKIKFSAKAYVDQTDNVPATVVLGKDYHFTPAYEFTAPLAMDNGTQIVYKDSTDGWNKDLKDIDLQQGSRIVVEADVTNSTPLNLKVSATPKFTTRHASGITIDVATDKPDNLLNASQTSHLTITITETAAGAFKQLDGIVYKASAFSSESIPLNKDAHTLKMENIKVTFQGQAVIDAN